jgi:glycosyltransferase involved in cell wall biosynthesis
LTSADFGQLVDAVRELVLDPGLREEMSRKALRYAEEFSWRNRALKHFELAEQLHRFRLQRLVPALPLATDTAAAGRAPSIG